MQIISYVGSQTRYRNSYRPKNLFLKLKSQSYFSKSYRLENRTKFFGDLNLKKILYLVSAVSILFFVPITLYKVISHFRNFTGPVKIDTNFETETENLKMAMANFAVEGIFENVDENGNLLNEDGSILTVDSLGIIKAVSFIDYKIKSGETISSIAVKFGLTNISTLIAVNNIENVRSIRSGQTIKIPNQDGLNHIVKKGDSINSISVKYHVSVEDILDANELSDERLFVGQKIFIPGARLDSSSLKKALGELFSNPIKSRYKISSYFGKRADPFTGVASFHTGIDLACPAGTPVNATMGGKIVYVGWSNIFGNYVIINHGNGYQSLYGHLLKVLCRSNQNVSQGEKIGLVGSTGYSTGPHLHFTVYKNGKLVDPLTLLKK